MDCRYLDECIKLTVTTFIFKHGAAFLRGRRSAGTMLADFHGNVRDSSAAPMLSSRSPVRGVTRWLRFESVGLQSMRANPVMVSWQDGMKETIIEISKAAGRVDPKAKGVEAEGLTGRNTA